MKIILGRIPNILIYLSYIRGGITNRGYLESNFCVYLCHFAS